MRLLTRSVAVGGALLFLAAGCGGDDDEESFDREDCIDRTVEFLNSFSPEEIVDVDREAFEEQARDELGTECYATIEAGLTDAEAEAMIARVDPAVLEAMVSDTSAEFEEVGESISDP